MKVTKADKTLKLETDGHLRIAFLGVGSAFSIRNFQNNFFIIKGKTSILVDCGTKASLRLHNLGLSVLDVKAVLPSHSHADHVGSIEELALKSRYVAPLILGGKRGDHRPDCIITHEYEPILWNETLRGGLAYSEEINLGGAAGEMQFGHYFASVYPRLADGYQRPTYVLDYGGIELKIMRTQHIPEGKASWRDSYWSTGLVVDDRVFLSGDTVFDEELVMEYGGDGVEAIFHDVQSFPGGVHAAYEQLATLPAHITAKTYLVHMDDNCYDFNPKDDGFADFTCDATEVYYDFE
jgi:ribonuclease BN (tRNA processing enzyme)